MATYEGTPALLGTVRHYSRGFYVVDLVDPDPVHAHLDPMYLRGAQFSHGVLRGDGQRVVLQYRTDLTSERSEGLWRAVANANEGDHSHVVTAVSAPDLAAAVEEHLLGLGELSDALDRRIKRLRDNLAAARRAS